MGTETGNGSTTMMSTEPGCVSEAPENDTPAPVAAPAACSSSPLARSSPLETPPRVPFTLIELLVVITIISILASMLLPALQMARAKATESVCRNQAKQLAMVGSFYADDYDGWLPHQGGNFGGDVCTEGNPVYADGTYWAPALNNLEYLDSTWTNYHDENGILICPSNKDGIFDNWGGPGKVRVKATYGPNQCVCYDRSASSCTWYRLGTSTVDAAMPLVLECYRYPWVGRWRPADKFAWPHRNGMNVAFVDGHVDRAKRFTLGGVPWVLPDPAWEWRP